MSHYVNSLLQQHFGKYFQQIEWKQEKVKWSTTCEIQIREHY